MGKPLYLEHERHVPAEYRLAYRIMRDYNTQPDWIASAKSIAKDLDSARQGLLAAGSRFHTLLTQLDGRYDLNSVQQRLNARDQWRHDQASFVDAIMKINKRILACNLKVPSFHLTRDLLDPEQEIARLLG